MATNEIRQNSASASSISCVAVQGRPETVKIATRSGVTRLGRKELQRREAIREKWRRGLEIARLALHEKRERKKEQARKAVQTRRRAAQERDAALTDDTDADDGVCTMNLKKASTQAIFPQRSKETPQNGYAIAQKWVDVSVEISPMKRKLAMELKEAPIITRWKDPWDFVIPRSLSENVSFLCGNCEKNRRADLKSTAKVLPEGLVEMIIARIPFPFVLKARSLSKAWAAKFCSAAPPGLSSFQLEVLSVSHKWNIYCPLFCDERRLIGLEKSGHWQRFSTDSYRSADGPRIQFGVGSLVCHLQETSAGSKIYDIMVTNTVTRNWKRLPSRTDKRIPSDAHVVPFGREGYRIVILPQSLGPSTYLEIYYSILGTWFTKRLPRVSYTTLVFISSTYFLGDLYILYGSDRRVPRLLVAYGLEKCEWSYVANQFPLMKNYIKFYEILACDSEMMFVVALERCGGPDTNGCSCGSKDVVHTGSDSILVYSVNLDSSNLKEVSRGPPESVVGTAVDSCTSDDSCIYFVGDQTLSVCPVIAFNVRKREWTNLPPPPFYTETAIRRKSLARFAFHPGLNPFVPV